MPLHSFVHRQRMEALDLESGPNYPRPTITRRLTAWWSALGFRRQQRFERLADEDVPEIDKAENELGAPLDRKVKLIFYSMHLTCMHVQDVEVG